MGETENIGVVRRIEDAHNSGALDSLDELIAADVVAHTPGSEMMPPGLEGVKAASAGGKQTFPDGHGEVVDAFGEGDKVVARIHFTGTNRGGVPWAGIPANDMPVDFESVVMFRLEGGKVVETWAQMEIPKMMMQLGAMPGM